MILVDTLLRCRDRMVSVQAYRVGAFAVHRRLPSSLVFVELGWGVTHVTSGMGATFGMTLSAREAFAVANALKEDVVVAEGLWLCLGLNPSSPSEWKSARAAWHAIDTARAS